MKSIHEYIAGRRYEVSVKISGGRAKIESSSINGVPYSTGDKFMDQLRERMLHSPNVEAEKNRTSGRFDEGSNLTTEVTVGGLIPRLKGLLSKRR